MKNEHYKYTFDTDEGHPATIEYKGVNFSVYIAEKLGFVKPEPSSPTVRVQVPLDADVYADILHLSETYAIPRGTVCAQLIDVAFNYLRNSCILERQENGDASA